MARYNQESLRIQRLVNVVGLQITVDQAHTVHVVNAQNQLEEQLYYIQIVLEVCEDIGEGLLSVRCEVPHLL